MKSVLGFTIILILCLILLILLAAMSGGCAIFQPGGGGGTLADLPTTGPEAMFQTLKKANWLFTLSIVGVGAGFFAFLNGSSKGLQFMAACFVVISLIIGVTRYSAVIAVISLIGAACLMIYSTLVKGKALREVIRGVQNVRDAGSLDGHVTENNVDMDHNDVISSYLDNVQSKTTKAIVKAVKGKL